MGHKVAPNEKIEMQGTCAEFNRLQLIRIGGEMFDELYT